MIQYLLAAGFGLAALAAAAAKLPSERLVGVAKVDITPDHPIWLAGYANRRSESEGVAQHLYAKALAIGSDRERPAILITVDNCGVPGSVRDEVAAYLKKLRHIDPARVVVCSTHTHSAPWLKGYLPILSLTPLSAEQEGHRETYTRALIGWLEKAAVGALDSRQPARLTWGHGSAGFAANRRTKGGPVDRDLPVLFVSAPGGELRAIFTSYACHCTTLTGTFNQACGDWAGYAQEYLEAEHPGAIALVAQGCAGDANPEPRPGLEFARRHGREIASAIGGVMTNQPTPVEGKLQCRTQRIQLPYDTLPTPAEWAVRARDTNFAGLHARLNLARLDRGESLPTALSYTVQVWTFGQSLEMVFLPGEVVVDYSLRLKKELDARKLWVNAYANDVPCYIPSERILQEGGYEGGGAMVYYDRPNRFAAGIENRIVSAVRSLTPKAFYSKPASP